jgi:multiple sugar transport system ATP-binding protein
VPGRLAIIEPTGPDTYATVDTPLGQLTARVPGVLHAGVGENVHLRWQPQHAHLFDARTEARVA